MTANASIPVLIVGAGPAGLVTALDLARHGVRSMIVERHAGTSIFPRATAISLRSMEILRGLGLEEEIRAFSLDASPMMSVSETLSAPEIMQVPLGFPWRDASDAISPTRPAISPQDHVEPVLLRRLKALGMTAIMFDAELVAFEQSADGVAATLVDRTSGREIKVSARFLVGADGGRSTVRDLLGIEAVGPGDLEHYAVTLFKADLWSILGERRHGLYGVGGPADGGVVVPMGPDDRWAFASPMAFDDAERLVADPQRCMAAVRQAAGVADLDVEILAAMPLTFAAQIATRWRDGNAFLIGDAAHRMPPFGGRGMNTAIADAHNLAWKLAWVERGLADRSLLDTFEAERGPVGRANIALALARYPDRLADMQNRLGLPMGEGIESTPDGLAEDVGYAYRSATIQADVEAADRVAGTRPGARAPHAWLGFDGGRVSTLDLFGDGLVLVVRGAGGAWRRAADALRPARSVLQFLGAVGPAMAYSPAVPLAVRSIGRGLTDPDDSFAAAYGLDDGGAVLVRPDGHVAWRWTAAPADHRSALAEAVATTLGHRLASRSAAAAPARRSHVGRADVPVPAA